jgi:hypothetical protein
MTSARRRRHQRSVRYAAYVAPVAVIASTAAAVVVGGWWLWAGSAFAALISLILAGVVLKLDRRWRTDVAATRAALAAEYAKEQAQYSDEHRSFTNHMVSLLDAASVRISVLRRRVDSLEREIAISRFAQSTPPSPRLDEQQTESVADTVAEPVAEWTDLWPDLADAPTVVDLIKWDEKTRAEIFAEDDADQRDEGEPQQRTA